jgi:hypothetical protein
MDGPGFSGNYIGTNSPIRNRITCRQAPVAQLDRAADFYVKMDPEPETARMQAVKFRETPPKSTGKSLPIVEGNPEPSPNVIYLIINVREGAETRRLPPKSKPFDTAKGEPRERRESHKPESAGCRFDSCRVHFAGVGNFYT